MTAPRPQRWWPSRALWRGYLLCGAAVLLVGLALAFEHDLPFNEPAMAVTYLGAVSALMLLSLWFFAVALWKGAAWEKLLAVPPVVAVLLYHLIALSGP